MIALVIIFLLIALALHLQKELDDHFSPGKWVAPKERTYWVTMTRSGSHKVELGDSPNLDVYVEWVNRDQVFGRYFGEPDRVVSIRWAAISGSALDATVWPRPSRVAETAGERQSSPVSGGEQPYTIKPFNIFGGPDIAT
jgi:hypothetical protein